MKTLFQNRPVKNILTIFITLALLAGLPAKASALTSYWEVLTLDSSRDVGRYASLAVVNGYPAISYYDYSNTSLKFIRAKDASGTDWGIPQTLDSTGTPGSHTSLAVVNGNPAISYFDLHYGTLKFIRAEDANGTIWGSPQTLDSSAAVGQFTSLVVVNGYPAISYYDETNSALKFIRAKDANGTDWEAPLTLDSTGTAGQYNSMAIVNGRPAISYHCFSSNRGDLKYIQAKDASGIEWNNPQTVDSAIVVGEYSSLAVVNGYPAISYYNYSYRDLQYIRARDADGTTWGSPQTLASSGSVGRYSSLAVVHGVPAISYYDESNGYLNFIMAKDADGNDWLDPQTMDRSGNVGWHTSLTAVNGNPAIAYYDHSYADLKYTYVQGTIDFSLLESGNPLSSGSTLDFGSTTLYTPLTKTLALQNNGTKPLDLDSLSLPDGFSLTGDYETRIPAGDSLDIQVSLNAHSTGTFSGSLTIQNQDTENTPYTLTLTGEVTTPRGEIAVSENSSDIPDGSGSVDFGSTTTGTPLSKTFTVENSGAYDLQLLSLSLPTGFSLVSSYDSIVSSSDSTDIQISLNAQTAGTFSGEFSLANNDADEDPYNFTITGEVSTPRGEIAIREGVTDIPDGSGSVDFGTTTTGTAVTKTFTVENSGGYDLTLGSLSLPNGFSMVGSYASSVSPGSSASLQVRLDAQTTGTYSGEFSLANNDEDENPYNFTISGEVITPRGEIAISEGGTDIPDGSGSVNFGSTTTGTAVTKTFTVENSGGHDLTLGTLSLPNGFSLVGSYASSVTPGSSTTLQVRLDAQTTGTFSGEFSLANNDADENPYNFTISGEVITPRGEIAISEGGNDIPDGSGSVDFGTTTTGTAVSKTFTIRNSGAHDLDLGSLSLPNGFSLVGSYASSVTPGSSTSLQVRLDAQTSGTFSGEFSLVNNDADEDPYNFTLSGTASAGMLKAPLISPVDGSVILNSTLQVAFNQPVKSDGGPEAANNPANYLLVKTGSNGLFDTSTCAAGVEGDDIEVTISSVTYDSTNFIVTITPEPLSTGKYQLLVCGTTSIEGLDGNLLNNGLYDSSTSFTVISNSSGEGGGTLPGLPATGFAPGLSTRLPAQPESKLYSDLPDLSLNIPELGINLPILGVPQTENGWDVTWLTNSEIGWLNGSAFPTWEGNTVLTGHVTNASGQPGPFAELKQLKYGDTVMLQAYGQTYTYEVRESILVLPNNLNSVMDSREQDWVTLMTCEYYNELNGEYLFRRVVRAVLVGVE